MTVTVYCYHEKKKQKQKKTEKIFIMILNVKLKCVGIDFWAFSDMTDDNLITQCETEMCWY